MRVPDQAQEWLTVDQVAQRFQVDEETVRRWIRKGDLPVLTLGAARAGYRIRAEDLEQFVAERYGRVGKAAA
jgi:excisionase family DNA binding protein